MLNCLFQHALLRTRQSQTGGCMHGIKRPDYYMPAKKGVFTHCSYYFEKGLSLHNSWCLKSGVPERDYRMQSFIVNDPPPHPQDYTQLVTIDNGWGLLLS